MPIYGDVNGDGTRGTKDLSKILSHVNGTESLTDDAFFRADINNDGIVNESDLQALDETLTETVSVTKHFDDTEISGEFKIKATGDEPFSGHFSLNDIIKNDDGSFTSLTTSIEEGHGFSILTVNFVYNTETNFKSNDGVFLANTEYEVYHGVVFHYLVIGVYLVLQFQVLVYLKIFLEIYLLVLRINQVYLNILILSIFLKVHH